MQSGGRRWRLTCVLIRRVTRAERVPRWTQVQGTWQPCGGSQASKESLDYQGWASEGCRWVPRTFQGDVGAVMQCWEFFFLFIFFNGPDAFFYEVTESSNSTFSRFDFDLIGYNKVFCLFFPPAKRHNCVCLSSKEKVNLFIWWESELDAVCKVFLFLRCLHPATCSCGGSLNWAWFVEGVGADGGGGGRKWIWSLMRVSAQRFPIMSASIRHTRSGK